MLYRRLGKVTLIVAVALKPAIGLAQSGTSAVMGMVRDTTGGSVPGASVRVINEDTGIAFDAATNAEGAYRVGSLVPGTYRLEVTLSGDTQRLRPFPQFSNVTLINPSIGNSNYLAGFIRVQKRFADGFSLLAHCTRSR